ncbi:6383_t:CDS:1, partial [Acaulospora morrowiae]
CQRRDSNSISKFLTNLSLDKEHYITETSVNKALVHSSYTEEEFNMRLKKETDALQLKFIEASKQRILEINIALSCKSAKLCVETMKSWIRDGSIYIKIRELEIKDGNDYSDRKK